MSDLKSLDETIKAVLRAVIDAQHSADVYARKLAPHYGPGGELEGLPAPRARMQCLSFEVRPELRLKVCQDADGELTTTLEPLDPGSEHE